MDNVDPDLYTYPFQLTKTLHRQVYPFLEPKQDALAATSKTVLITGVGGDLGPAIAKAWCMAKAKGVMITSRNKQALENVAAELRKISPSTKIVVQPSDSTSEASVQELFKVAKSELGSLDVLVNSAATLTPGKIGDTEISTWWTDHETNVKGLYLLVQGFLQFNGQHKGATFVNIGTAAAALVVPGMSSYITSKLAQQKLLELVQAEHPDLRVFNALPGIPYTKMTQPDFIPYARDELLLSGALSLFLTTPRADWLKGQTVSINWDLEEMEANKEAILSGQLNRLGWLRGNLQKGGHPF